MAAAGRLGICLDEACGRPLAGALRDFRAPGHPDIHDVRDLGLGGVADDVLMRELGRRGIAALATLDSRILDASIRRDAWRDSGLTLFVLTGKWGNLSLFEQARRIVWWWPLWVARVADGPYGAAWRVSPELSPGQMARLLGRGDTP